MKFIDNIKFNYRHKILSDLISKKDIAKIKSELVKTLSYDQVLSYKLFKVFAKDLMDLGLTSNLFNHSSILINSFIKEDQSIISDFLKFYFREINYSQASFTSYIDAISLMDKTFFNREKIEFQNIIEISMIYQAMLDLKREGIDIINNDNAFFSTESEFNFTHPNLVKCFFLLVDNPFSAYKQIKSQFKLDQNLARAYMFNLDPATPYDLSCNHKKIVNFKQDWRTYTQSWTDQNIVSSFKGLIIKKNNLLTNPEETLSEIILHLIQSQLKIPMDYGVIEKYSSSLKLDDFEYVEISNKEKKFIENNLKDFEFD